MIYLLDTDISSYLQARVPDVLRQRVERIGLSSLAISAITEAEIWFGLYNKNVGLRRFDTAMVFLRSVNVLDWPAGAARIYGELRVRLRRQGERIEDRDLLIAAHAIATGSTLVTNNTRHFARIGNDWRHEES